MKDWIVFEKYNNVSLFWQLVAYYDLTWGGETDKNSILTHYKVAHMDLEEKVPFSLEIIICIKYEVNLLSAVFRSLLYLRCNP